MHLCDSANASAAGREGNADYLAVSKVERRNLEMLFVRGDGVILV